jgi:hypothetical protein
LGKTGLEITWKPLVDKGFRPVILENLGPQGLAASEHYDANLSH